MATWLETARTTPTTETGSVVAQVSRPGGQSPCCVVAETAP